MLENFTIKTAVGGIGDNLLDPIIADLSKKDPTLSEDEAIQLAVQRGLVDDVQIEAKKIVNKEIAPTMMFISRHANLYAVKPCIMYTSARIRDD